MSNGQTYNDVAVLIPCYNEDITIQKVINDFKTELPGAQIWVFDNNSTDQTALKAKTAGAHVVPSHKQGKGHVVKHMFDMIDSPIYIMVDGDDTYPASSAPTLIEEYRKGGTDMVVGVRMNRYEHSSFRMFHKFGNNLVARLISWLFSSKVSDVLSGYRVFSREMVKSIPIMSKGFEIETELTLQALSKHFIIKELPINYGSRPEGSYSKLNTFSDGYLVLKAIFLIFKDYKPLIFFSILGFFFLLLSLLAGFFPIRDYFETAYVEHVPLAILAAGLGIISVLCFSVGCILDTTCKYHHENFVLWRRFLKK